MNVTSLLFIRFSLASLFFFAYLLKGHFGIKVKTKQLGLLAIVGLFYVSASICYLSALRYIPASLNAFIHYIYPAFVCFLSFVFNREAFTLKIGLSLGLAMFGLMLILGTSFQGVNLIGSLLSLGSAVIYSFYIIICQRLLKHLSPRMMSAYVTFFAALSLLLLQWVLGQKIRFDFAPTAWVFILSIVLFSTVIPIFLFMRGLQFLGSNRAAILCYDRAPIHRRSLGHPIPRSSHRVAIGWWVSCSVRSLHRLAVSNGDPRGFRLVFRECERGSPGTTEEKTKKRSS